MAHVSAADIRRTPFLRSGYIRTVMHRSGTDFGCDTAVTARVERGKGVGNHVVVVRVGRCCTEA